MQMQAIGAIMIPFVGTVLGSAGVFFLKGHMNRTLQRALIGFASGVMVAASVWSLIIPAIDQAADMGKWSFVPAVIGFWLGIIMLLALAIFWFMLHKTTFGRKIYATGSNIKCANLVGVDTTKTKIIVYAISGFMAALAGLIMISRVDSAQSILGDGYELDAIAAVALGGTSMSGGRGKIMGTFAGVLIIAVLNNGMNIMNISSYYQQVVKAVVILVAVLSDRKR